MIGRTIAISLSPNASTGDVELAGRELIHPSGWQSGSWVRRVEEWFGKYFDIPTAVTFHMGRSSLFAVLEALGIGAGDEVLLQAYTCVVVPNEVIWAGARPVYVDIAPGTFNMDPADFARKVTSATKAVIVQHTFGHPAPMAEIQSVARKHGLLLIEDCAHALGARFNGKLAGTWGDAAFFSFGRDKVVSSVHGGAAITTNRKVGERLEEIRTRAPFPPRWWIAQQLVHPIIFAAVIPWYFRASIGKAAIVALQRAKVLSMAVTAAEKRGVRPPVHLRRFPNALAALAFRQLGELEALNAHRQEIRRTYDDVLSGSGIAIPSLHNDDGLYLRYTLQVPNPRLVHQVARRNGVLLGDWYDAPISPATADPSAAGYEAGSCPVAEETARHSLNLPTHRGVLLADARRIAHLVVEAVHG